MSSWFTNPTPKNKRRVDEECGKQWLSDNPKERRLHILEFIKPKTSKAQSSNIKKSNPQSQKSTISNFQSEQKMYQTAKIGFEVDNQTSNLTVMDISTENQKNNLVVTDQGNTSSWNENKSNVKCDIQKAEVAVVEIDQKKSMSETPNNEIFFTLTNALNQTSEIANNQNSYQRSSVATDGLFARTGDIELDFKK